MSKGEQSKWVRVMPERFVGMVSEQRCPWNRMIHHRLKSMLPMLGSIVVGQIVYRNHVPQKDSEIYTQHTWRIRNAQIPKISQVANRCMAYISISREHHLCQCGFIKFDIGQLTHKCKSNFMALLQKDIEDGDWLHADHETTDALVSRDSFEPAPIVDNEEEVQTQDMPNLMAFWNLWYWNDTCHLPLL